MILFVSVDTENRWIVPIVLILVSMDDTNSISGQSLQQVMVIVIDRIYLMVYDR